MAGQCGIGADVGPCYHWERPIASFRSTNIHLTSVGGGGATLWYLPGAALSGAFSPVLVSSGVVPSALADPDNRAMDRSQVLLIGLLNWVSRLGSPGTAQFGCQDTTYCSLRAGHHKPSSSDPPS